MNTSTTWRAALLLLAAWALAAPGARAHQGAPFPVVVDEAHPPWKISIWADPDIGVGSFYVLLDPSEGETLPADSRVEVHYAPLDGHAGEKVAVAYPQNTDQGQRHVAKANFPSREYWAIRVVVSSPSSGEQGECRFNVEATPPGYGPADLAIYTTPFVMIAGLWLLAMRKRRALTREAEARLAAADDETSAG